MTVATADSKDKSKQDLLLECLVFLTGFFGHARSAEALVAGLAIDKRGMTPKSFCIAADRAGLRARVMRRKPSKIPPEVLPAVIIASSGAAHVLLRLARKNEAVILDLASRTEKTVPMKDLMKETSGYAIYIKPHYAADESSDGAPLSRHWFWGAVSECSGIYFRVLMASVLINIFALVSPIYIMNFYNRVLPNDAVETGWVLSIGAASVFLFDFVIKSLRGYFIDIAGRRSDVAAAQRLYDQVLDMRLAVRPPSTGAFANIMREFDSVREFFNSATMTALVDFPFSLLFIAAIWVIAGAQVAALLLALYFMVLIVGYIMQIPVRRKVHEAMKTAEQKHGLLVETISGIETIRGASGEGALRSLYGFYTGKAAEAGAVSRYYSGVSVHFSAFIQQLSTVLIVLLGMYLIKDKQMTVGALMACVMLSSRAIAPLGALASLVNKYHQAKSSYRALDAIMRHPVERPRDAAFLHRPKISGNIEFKGVSFAYPRTNRPVLQEVTANIRAGEKVAIVGRIGSGKSSLIKMIVNFYEPTAGAILADGTDIRQIDPADLRRNVAYMGQEAALMSGTIRSNIVMGRPDASDAEVLKAAEFSGAHDFIRRHPLGYDAPVGEHGLGLSGGQRQAVALARTLLMDAPVLVMDEPTNAMDSATEDKVIRALESYARNKTLILVTHKPALLRLVSRLIVLDQGKVYLDGPRDQVLQALSGGGKVEGQ